MHSLLSTLFNILEAKGEVKNHSFSQLPTVLRGEQVSGVTEFNARLERA